VWHLRGTGQVHKSFCWEDLKEEDNLELIVVDGRIILKLIFRKWDVGAWIGLI
jgi:hypothetical protein